MYRSLSHATSVIFSARGIYGHGLAPRHRSQNSAEEETFRLARSEVGEAVVGSCGYYDARMSIAIVRGASYY
jgi:hypothetical protein